MKKLCLGLLSFDFLALLALCARYQFPLDLQGQESSLEAAAQLCDAEVPAVKAAASVRPASGIQWFATWESGLSEAKRTGQPILLVAAAPHCAGVSGMW